MKIVRPIFGSNTNATVKNYNKLTYLKTSSIRLLSEMEEAYG
jgi:hypothetical protein